MNEKTRTSYNTDLTDKEWEILNIELVKGPKKKSGKPVKVARREAINAVLYRMNTGCQWRNLPHDFPKWATVYKTYRRWSKSGVWTRIHDALCRQVRKKKGGMRSQVR
ncbi:MAG: transposase [Opitutaceae bacterium]|jgi:transposase|nr:transposase [Opitutaceae bacterium]